MPRILAVDDNVQNRYMLEVLLKGQGHTVDTAVNGEEALDIARRNLPDLVLSDILMPGMDGFALCREWKSDEKLCRVPFVFYTATYTDPKDERFALSLGADGFLVKPTEPEELVGFLEGVLAKCERLEPGSQPALGDDDVAYLQQYNEALVRKLESRTLQLEQRNNALDQQLAELQRVHEALRASEKKYRRLVESLERDYIIYSHDTAGVFTYASPSVVNVLGYTQEEFQTHYARYLTDNPINEEARRCTGAAIGGEPQAPFVAELRRRDGTVCQLEVVERPVLDEGGSVVAVEGIAHDITERLRAEAERTRLATVVEQTGEGVVITDAEGVIQYVNPSFERTTGYTPEEALGKTPRILKSGQHDDEFYRKLWSTITAGRIWTGRIVNKRKDGSLFTELATISPIKDQQGAIVGHAAIKRDMTEQILLEEELQQAGKMEAVGELAGGVAHDFNNCLTVIMASAQMLRQKMATDERCHRSVESILDASRQAAGVTKSLLTFSRRVPTEKRPLDLRETVEEAARMLGSLLPATIELVVDTAGDAPIRVDADATQIQQIIINLAVNARDAMPEGGILRVSVAPSGDEQVGDMPGTSPSGETYARLAVSDAGTGMSEEVRARAFDPFFTTKPRGKGTGLGLSIIHRIVTDHGGHIDVQSEEGKGTTFTILIPQLDTEQTVAKMAGTGRIAGEGARPAAEDGPPVCRPGAKSPEAQPTSTPS